MANGQRELEAIERQKKALELRQQGRDYDEIARELGYASKSGAYKAVRSALRKTLREPADELRELELTRLDSLWRPLYTKALDCDDKAIGRCLGIMKRRAELLGLDAAKKLEHKPEDDSQQRLLALAEAVLKRRQQRPSAAEYNPAVPIPTMEEVKLSDTTPAHG